MPRKAIVCAECGKNVPYGRAACAACGALIAGVSRAAPDRPTTSGVPATSNGPLPAASAATLPEAGPRRMPSILQEWPPQPPRSLDEPTGRDLEGVSGGRWSDQSDLWTDEPRAHTNDDHAPRSNGNPTANGHPAWPQQTSGAYVPPSGAYVPPSRPDEHRPRPGAARTSPTQQYGATVPSAGYLEPSGVFTATGVAQAGDVPAHVRQARQVGSPAAPGPAAMQAAQIADPGSGPAPGVASLFADLPFDAPNTITGWLMAVGTGAAALGFLLPWSNVMIGAASADGGYTATWGVASPTHTFMLLAVVAGFLLSVLPNRVPTWLRTSALGMLLGGVLVGLAWPYVFEGLGFQVGLILELVGAALLIVAGILSILPARHDADEAVV